MKSSCGIDLSEFTLHERVYTFVKILNRIDENLTRVCACHRVYKELPDPLIHAEKVARQKNNLEAQLLYQTFENAYWLLGIDMLCVGLPMFECEYLVRVCRRFRELGFESELLNDIKAKLCYNS